MTSPCATDAAVGGGNAKVALVHEWLATRAGSEKTFEQMAAAIPSADLFALTRTAHVRFRLNRPVRTTVLQRFAWLAERRAVALPTMPLAWRSLRVDRYDAVVTSSHAFARYFPIGNAVHLSYVYTPLRYAWMPDVDGRGARRIHAPGRAVLRRLDRHSTRSVTSFAAISTAVAERIGQFYGREATVLYPPVDINYFRPDDSPRRDFLLGVSRWIPYKRMDLVLQVADRLRVPCVLAGDGPERERLESLAEGLEIPVQFVTRPSDAVLRELYRTASALVFPAEEDFGIVPVEAQACGTPVVAYSRGGSAETVLHGDTGILASRQTVDDFAASVQDAWRIRTPRSEFRTHVQKFSTQSFQSNFRQWVNAHLST